MKLDRLKFATLVAFICGRTGCQLDAEDINQLDNLIDVEAPEAHVAYPSTSDINELMRLMAGGASQYPNGSSKIEAIKLHRKLTGYGLKESKDEVEKHWGLRRTKQECYDKLRVITEQDQLTTEKHNEYSRLINLLF